MSPICLIEGPVGAGKSTFAAGLCEERHAVHLNLDDWMARLFRPDRPQAGVMPWYIERKDRCIEQIWRVSDGIARAGGSVVLELGLVQRVSRLDFYARVDASAHRLQVFVLDAPREIRRERVRRRNVEKGATFSMEVPDHFFELASDLWEPPDEEEAQERQIQFIDTGGVAPPDRR